MKHDFRQLYQPKTRRVPEWLRQLWLWM